MFESVRDAIEQVRECLAALEPALLTGECAADGVALFAEMERLSSAGRTLLAKRVDETHAWASSGKRSMAAWMADQAGTSVGAAIGVTQTSWQLGQQPEIADALRSGQLSTVVATELSSAAAAAPDEEAGLVSFATRPGSTVRSVRERCVAVRAAAADDADLAARQRARTTFRTWTERDGMVGFSALYPPLIGASLRAAIDQKADEIFRRRRRTKDYESRDKYAADALTEIVTSGGGDAHRKGRTRANVRIRVDVEALRRGYALPNEDCRTEGVGPLSVPEIIKIIDDIETIVDVVLTDGVDVLKIKRLDRYIPRALRTAIEFENETCMISGCDERAHLENDHLLEVARNGPTSLANVKPKCHYHHTLKTQYGWTDARTRTAIGKCARRNRIDRRYCSYLAKIRLAARCRASFFATGLLTTTSGPSRNRSRSRKASPEMVRVMRNLPLLSSSTCSVG